MTTPNVLRYSTFADVPQGGNPAGVVLDANTMADEVMLAIAADVGYSETAFLVPLAPGEEDASHYRVRYFSPEDEVPFCGHATIASGVALAEMHGIGDLVFHTNAMNIIGRDLALKARVAQIQFVYGLSTSRICPRRSSLIP